MQELLLPFQLIFRATTLHSVVWCLTKQNHPGFRAQRAQFYLAVENISMKVTRHNPFTDQPWHLVTWWLVLAVWVCKTSVGKVEVVAAVINPLPSATSTHQFVWRLVSCSPSQSLVQSLNWTIRPSAAIVCLCQRPLQQQLWKFCAMSEVPPTLLIQVGPVLSLSSPCAGGFSMMFP